MNWIAQRIVAIAATVPLLAAAQVMTAAPANAATWWGISTAGASASGSWYHSGGRAYITGKVCDTAADARSATLTIHFNHHAIGTNGGWGDREEVVSATGGVNTCKYFSFNSVHTGNLWVNIAAGNWTSGVQNSKWLY